MTEEKNFFGIVKERNMGGFFLRGGTGIVKKDKWIGRHNKWIETWERCQHTGHEASF